MELYLLINVNGINNLFWVAWTAQVCPVPVPIEPALDHYRVLGMRILRFSQSPRLPGGIQGGIGQYSRNPPPLFIPPRQPGG